MSEAATSSCWAPKSPLALYHMRRWRWAIGDGQSSSSAKISRNKSKQTLNTMQTKPTTAGCPTRALQWVSTARGIAGLYRTSLANIDLVELGLSGVLPIPLSYRKLWFSLVFFGIAQEQTFNQKHHWNTRWKPKTCMIKVHQNCVESTVAEQTVDT